MSKSWWRSRRFLLIGAAGLGLLGCALPARAQDDSLRQRVEKLEKQNQELLQELRALQKTQTPAAPPPAPTAADGPGLSDKGQADVQRLIDDALLKRDSKKSHTGAPAPPKEESGFVAVGSDLAFKASWEDGFVARTANDDFRFHMGGKVQQDWGAFRPDAHFNQSFPGGWDPGADFRSLRLRADGTCWEVIDFVLEMDFISSSNLVANGINPNFPTPTDVYFDVKELPWLGTFRAGHFKEPFSLERYGTSETDLTFLERSSAHDAFDPVRNIGMMFFNTAFDQHMTWATGLFRTHSDANSGSVFDYANHGLATTSRVTFNPWYAAGGRCVVDFGAAYSWRGLDPDDTGNAAGENPSRARFSSRMPLRVGSPVLVDTGFLLADAYELFNLQALLIYGPFSIQSEYYAAQVDGLNRGQTPAKRPLMTDPACSGFYIQASYFLTGENRVFRRNVGGLGKVHPFENFFLVRDEHGHRAWGLGAWEIACRYDYLNLTSASFGPIAPGTPPLPTAGVLQSAIVGLNWYLNPSFKVQWNWVHTWRADGYVANGNGAVDGIGMRFNWDF